MSEIAQSGGGGHKKGTKVRSKKMSTRIDMTPMVDLAFLLLTFFVLTTTLTKPKTMEIVVPEKPKPDDPEPPKLNENRVVTLILGKDHKVYWYKGLAAESIQQLDFGKDGLRKTLADQKKLIAQKFSTEKDPSQAMFVLIKPQDVSTYADMVDALDEMKIADVKRYALMDITPEDNNYVGQYLTALGAPTTTPPSN